MSEYQYYEWQTIDRPFSAREQAEVNGFSSHGYSHIHAGYRHRIRPDLEPDWMIEALHDDRFNHPQP